MLSLDNDDTATTQRMSPHPAPRRVLTRLEQLGRAIRELREEREWNQAELGRRARPHTPISHTTISKIESGHTDSQFTTLDDICIALGTTLSDLLASSPTTRSLDKRHRQQLVAQTSRELYTSFESLVGQAVDIFSKLATEQH